MNNSANLPLLSRLWHLKTSHQRPRQRANVIPIWNIIVLAMPIELLRYITIDIKNINALIRPRGRKGVAGIEVEFQRVRSPGGVVVAAWVVGPALVGVRGDEVVLVGGVGVLAEVEVGVELGAVGGCLCAFGGELVGFVLAGGVLEDLPEGEGGFEVGWVGAVGAGEEGWGGEGEGEGERGGEEEYEACDWGIHCEWDGSRRSRKEIGLR